MPGVTKTGAGPILMDLTPEQFARLGQYFDEAVDLPQSGREAVIERVRRDESAEMADELARMLRANDEPTDTMDHPLVPRLAEPKEPRAFQDGEVILGRFRIVRLLGRGGMGEVYEAYDQELGPVALKTIRRDLAGDPDLMLRFKEEVRRGRQVGGPNVCKIYELFMLPGDSRHRVAAFLTMELLAGATLARRIGRGALPWSEAEPIAIKLCQGLDAIHATRLVHRDFKPGNVMLTRRGNVTQVVVMDFGLALQPDESQGLTRTGGFVGTPPYMAPEQFPGGGGVSAATDVYALGAVLYEMVTGNQAFDGSTPAAMRQKPPAASTIQAGLPRHVDRVIERCLEPKPADRYQTAAEVAKALQGSQPVPPPSRRWILYWGAGAAVAGAAATRFWPDIDAWRHPLPPLPSPRHVAAMIWPKLTDPQNVSLVSELLANISRELARAEAYDKEFLILDSGKHGGGYTADTPAEAAGLLGANLVLAASALKAASGLQIALAVLDPLTLSPLRQDKVSGSATTLEHRAAETAARLLGVRLDSAETKTGDDFTGVPASAHQLFDEAQKEMSLPDNEGLTSAIEKYQAATDEDKKFAAAYAGLAIAYGRRYAFFKKQSDLTMASQNSDLALDYAPTSSRAKFSRALIRLYKGDTDQAVQMFLELLKTDPGNEEVLMGEAQAFRETNQTEKEEQVYLNLLDRRPNYWPAHVDLGHVYRFKGAYRDAEDQYSQATSIAPRASIPWTDLGELYFLMGRMEESRTACQKAIACHPNEDAYIVLGDIAYAAHDYHKALDYFVRARDTNQNSRIAWQAMGDCYTMLGQPARTKESYAKAKELVAADLRVNPRDGTNWMVIAYYSAKLGDRTQAMQQLAEAERRGATDLEVQLVKAQILVLFGEKEKAIRLLLDLLNRGISRVDVNQAIDLQSVLGDPRLGAALQDSQ
jgi:tetratricopeptide (TPR) repeat protein